MRKIVDFFTRKSYEHQIFSGDRILLGMVILISLLSILPGYSASSQLQYVSNETTTIKFLGRHIGFMLIGFFVGFYVVKRLIMRDIRSSVSVLIVLWSIFLILTLVASVSGDSVSGAKAGRWIRIGPLSCQPSLFLYLSTIMLQCSYISKKADILREKMTFMDIFFIFIVPILSVGFVFTDNGSTGLIIMVVSIMIMLIGGIRLKYVIRYVILLVSMISVFVLLALKTDLVPNNRVHTWVSRIENKFSNDNADKDKNYQAYHARAAIYHGGIFGVGVGKSAIKQTLPQSVSDFIYVIVIEEYGLIGAVMLLFIYIMMIYRMMKIIYQVVGLERRMCVMGIMLMFSVQVLANIFVAVGIIPVTGQPLPFISAGGSAVMASYIQMAIVLRISEDAQIKDSKQKSEEEIDDIA